MLFPDERTLKFSEEGLVPSPDSTSFSMPNLKKSAVKIQATTVMEAAV